MNYVRGLLNNGFADLHNPDTWDLSFVKQGQKRETYEQMTKVQHCFCDFKSLVTLDVLQEIVAALDFMKACGAHDDPSMRRVELFSSHEGLVLDFEQAMTKRVGDKYYNVGAHFLWIGDRTRQLDGAHVEYFRGISNPIGIKVSPFCLAYCDPCLITLSPQVGPTTKPAELVELIQKINPTNEAGRITLITRFGAGNTEKMLPPVISAVRDAGLKVVYECDPMHGNTRKASQEIKTRSFDDILQELLETFDIHRKMQSWLGGVHFELTGDNVTECTGGATDLQDHDLSSNYESFCDPRLNYNQSLEMAFLIAKRLSTRHQEISSASPPQ